MAEAKRTISLQDQTNLLPPKQLIITFMAMSLGLFCSFIDQTAISVSLPAIAEDLNCEDTVSWAGTSLLIGTTTFQILSGRLSDIFGRKYLLMASLAILCLSQLGLSFCRTATQLYVLRGFSGIGDGGVTSLSMMLVSDLVTLEERGKYQGILGSCVGLGSMVGPFLSAAFTRHVNWKGIFWFSCPITALSMIIVGIQVPLPKGFKVELNNYKKIDGYGFITSSIGIILVLVALSGGGNTYAWDSAIVICLFSIGGVAFLVFLFTQWKISKLPMMPLSLYANLTIAIMLFQNILFGMVYFSNTYFLPIYFELVRGWSSTQSACLTLPLVFTQSFGSICAGFLVSRYRRYGYIVQFGYTVWFFGLGLQMGLFTQHQSMVGISFILFVEGLGVACVFQPTIIALQAHCRKRDRAVVISARNFNRSVGGSIGLAACTSILSNVLKSKVNKLDINASSEQIATLERTIFASPDLASFSQSDQILIKHAIYQSVHTVFIFFFPLLGACFVTCFLIKDRGLQNPDDLAEELALAQEKKENNAEIPLDEETNIETDSNILSPSNTGDGTERESLDSSRLNFNDDTNAHIRNFKLSITSTNKASESPVSAN